MTTTTTHSLELEPMLETCRPKLIGYCYRMVGSEFEAEDAVQETFVRAWRNIDRFEARASLETWLYRIATNVCLNLLRGRTRRALPMSLGPASPADTSLGSPRPSHAWIEPIPDARLLPTTDDPADLAASRDGIRLAFIAVLQLLPPRQRAVLILRDVLHWKATEVAALLDTTAVSVRSALQRARSTVARASLATRPLDPADATESSVLERYVDAFQRYDVDALVELLHEDATLSMPPYVRWLRGSADIRAWLRRETEHCRESLMIPTRANGSAAVAHYLPIGNAGVYEPFALHLLDVTGGRIDTIHTFIDQRLFPRFGLPAGPARQPSQISLGGSA
jgi:RNA polymerase sigma-70 factor, ECF subfamily